MTAAQVTRKSMLLCGARRLLPLLLALPAIFYVSIAAFWQTSGRYAITGDEPHYLLIADSIARDHDLLLENNYEQDTPVSRAFGSKLVGPVHAGHLANGFSVHGIGLPLLLALPYGLAGVAGAKLFMCLLAGLWPLLFYRVIRRILGSDMWAVMLALALGAALPLLAASNQIYPDLLGGLIVVYAADCLIRRSQGEDASAMGLLGTALLLAFLPWLHVRFAAPAIVLLLFYIMVEAHVRFQTVHGFLLKLAPILVTALFSFAFLGLYQYLAFGNALGPYKEGSLTLDGTKVAMVFLGLHWDVSQGVFMQQPLLMLGLIGLVPLWRKDRRAAVLLGALYLSILLPNAMHPNWYGGHSFIGRFGWAAALLWVFPLAYGAGLVIERWSAALALLCASSLALQGRLVRVWLVADRSLDNSGVGLPAWLRDDLLARAWGLSIGQRLFLPSFQQFDAYLGHSPNYLCLLFAILLVASGWLLHAKAARSLSLIWATSVAVGVAFLLLAPPRASTVSWQAAQLPGEVGGVEGARRVAEPGKNGCLMYGPYARLAPGTYQLSLRYQADEAAQPVAGWDITFNRGATMLCSGDLLSSNANGGALNVSFRVPPELASSGTFEFRVMYRGGGRLSLERLEVRPLSFGS